MKTFNEEFAREVLRCGEYIKDENYVVENERLCYISYVRIRIIKYYPTKDCKVEPEYYWLKTIDGEIIEFEQIGVN